MPLYLTGYHSSRVRKPGKPSPTRRSSSSPLAGLARSKPGQRTKSLSSDQDADIESSSDRLDATGRIISLAATSSVTGVIQAIQQSCQDMFSEIPEPAGMNSTRIAEVLNFRKATPPVVSLAHVHALVAASTRTEREISDLISRGLVRKITITGRGNDISGLGELLILMSDLERMIQESSLDNSVADSFLRVLRQNPKATSLSARSFSSSEATALIRGGFLVSPSLLGKSGNALSGGALVASATVSRAPSGTVAAVGGEAAFENLGGVGHAKRSDPAILSSGNDLALSIPNLGPFLRLLNSGRSYLIELLGKSQYNEAPLYLVRERWDSAFDSSNLVSSAKRVRGEFPGLLPGKTKKWKDFYGLNFNYILEECAGAGLVELFETHSVGYGIRMV